MKKIICNNINDLPEIAETLLTAYPEQRIFAFRGNLGAGKTTFIKELCRKLGATDHTGSPSFAIINEYATQSGETIYHFDFYRINHLKEALDIGSEDYFYSGNYCFIEWAENIAELLDDTVVFVDITIENQDKRVFEINF